MVERRNLFFSCEHGGNLVPTQYEDLFQDIKERLKTHRGYDPGALGLAKMLARGMAAPLVKSETTRLLVDLNRSKHSRALFSEAIKGLGKAEKALIIEQHYQPYRLSIKKKIKDLIDQGAQVVHLSIHSFTPHLDGHERLADLGLLYDPDCKHEKQFCSTWQQLLKERFPELKVRCNYPYLGVADGLVRSLRDFFSPQDYLGIELEVNQGLLTPENSFPALLEHGLLETLQDMLPTD